MIKECKNCVHYYEKSDRCLEYDIKASIERNYTTGYGCDKIGRSFQVRDETFYQQPQFKTFFSRFRLAYNILRGKYLPMKNIEPEQLKQQPHIMHNWMED